MEGPQNGRWVLVAAPLALAFCLFSACAPFLIGSLLTSQGVTVLFVNVANYPGILSGLGGTPSGAYFLGAQDAITYNGTAPNGDQTFKITNAGTVDATFNGGFPAGLDGINAAGLLQELNTLGVPTGRLLIGGHLSTVYGGSAAPDNLLRVSSTGTLDVTYNPGAGTGFNQCVRQMVQEIGTNGYPTGKVYAQGLFTSFNDSVNGTITHSGVLRVDSVGLWDTTFTSLNNANAGSGAGFVSWLTQELSATTGLPTGKVFVVGPFTAFNGDANTSRCIARLNQDGTLDTTWNYGAGRGISSCSNVTTTNSNVVVTEFGSNGLPTGKLLVGFTNGGCPGVCSTYTDSSGAHAIPNGLFRINAADGSWDSTFNNGGRGVNSGRDIRSAVQELDTTTGLPTGAWIIAGSHTSYNANANARYLTRITADGSYDATWGVGSAGTLSDALIFGIFVTYQVDSAGRQNGKYLLAGGVHTYLGNASQVGVIGVNHDGGWDLSFNTGGAGFPAAGWGGPIIPEFR